MQSKKRCMRHLKCMHSGLDHLKIVAVFCIQPNLAMVDVSQHFWGFFYCSNGGGARIFNYCCPFLLLLFSNWLFCCDRMFQEK